MLIRLRSSSGPEHRYRRVPFGLCNASSIFQHAMDLALNGFNFYMCLVYLDDIVVYSSTVEEHLLRLRKLFDRLRIANLKLKPSKCSLFLRAMVLFLGHVVSGDGVSTDPSKIDLVKNWPQPRDVHEVRSFLGLASYYRPMNKVWLLTAISTSPVFVSCPRSGRTRENPPPVAYP